MKEVIKTDSIYCTSIINCKRYNGRIRLGDFRGALLGHAHMRRSRLCSTKICESNRNCIVFIKDDGSDGD